METLIGVHKVFRIGSDLQDYLVDQTGLGRSFLHFSAMVGSMTTDWCRETELFPGPALEMYARYNAGLDMSGCDLTEWFSPLRGGPQGDYRPGMKEKVKNVVSCLSKFPDSKRAVITIPNRPDAKHSENNEQKCMREIHFSLHRGQLSAGVFMRAQAVTILPKNLYFVGFLMSSVADCLGVPLGSMFYSSTRIFKERSD
jgi:hypothetical protein